MASSSAHTDEFFYTTQRPGFICLDHVIGWSIESRNSPYPLVELRGRIYHHCFPHSQGCPHCYGPHLRGGPRVRGGRRYIHAGRRGISVLSPARDASMPYNTTLRSRVMLRNRVAIANSVTMGRTIEEAVFHSVSVACASAEEARATHLMGLDRDAHMMGPNSPQARAAAYRAALAAEEYRAAIRVAGPSDENGPGDSHGPREGPAGGRAN
ncbi:uncharacterized protein LOC124171468 [Ischnura elegans]|uniref:uncharacterized protein LOC124171468 n=1 Tax=Ischnura elegans TaxID=197161 RepID=UPI001ED86659|nr:uncharacterized protein LOC124171468 [Ischnura elegans]